MPQSKSEHGGDARWDRPASLVDDVFPHGASPEYLFVTSVPGGLLHLERFVCRSFGINSSSGAPLFTNIVDRSALGCKPSPPLSVVGPVYANLVSKSNGLSSAAAGR